MLNRITTVVIAALVVLGSIGSVAYSRQRDTLAAAQVEAKTASRRATDAIRVDSAKDASIDFYATVAARESHRADSLAFVAGSLAHRAAVSYTHAVTVASTAPDTCGPVIAAYDSAYHAADSARVAEISARLVAEGSMLFYERAYFPADSERKALRVELIAARNALDHVSAAAKPSLLARLTPKPGVGIAAGIDPLGRPTILAGVTLAWSR